MSKASETGAHKALTETARLRMLPSDGLEDTQPMTIISRRVRMDEAKQMWPQAPRERRKPSTVGQRRPDEPVDSSRQAVVDSILQGSKHV